jgi:hypothetical protein
MSPYSSAVSFGRGILAGHLVSLRGALEVLGEQLREAVARAVGRAAGDALRDALHATLDAGRGPARSALHTGPPRWCDSRESPAWARDPDDPGTRPTASTTATPTTTTRTTTTRGRAGPTPGRLPDRARASGPAGAAR